MSRIYTWLRKLEEKYPNFIFEMNYSKITQIGLLTVRISEHLRVFQEYEIHNFNNKLTFFEKKSGKGVKLFKELRSFDRCVVYRN